MNGIVENGHAGDALPHVQEEGARTGIGCQRCNVKTKPEIAFGPGEVIQAKGLPAILHAGHFINVHGQAFIQKIIQERGQGHGLGMRFNHGLVCRAHQDRCQENQHKSQKYSSDHGSSATTTCPEAGQAVVAIL